MNFKFASYSAIDIVVIEQFGLGDAQGLFDDPGLIAIAGQDEPEIDKRI